MKQSNYFPEFAAIMAAAGIGEAGVRAFRNSYDQLIRGSTGLIPENTIEPVTELPAFREIGATPDDSLLGQSVVLKLNGGLGTGMGLAGPKSLLPIKDGFNFLDFIAKQILHLRQEHGAPVRFLLMNSFSTSAETMAHLRRYPNLGLAEDLELMQGLTPKVDANTLRPVVWPAHPPMEWCPPGHGDLYPSLLGSGWLHRLLDAGVRYLFVSNSDNLGASLDLRLLTYFARSGKSFLMEVTERTDADKKGGHLARALDGSYLLRESAQCPEADLEFFQDTQRHRFFNTNNLWIRLDDLKAVLDQHEGVVPLPLIKNQKTVDPRDAASPAVFQLETAMGAAIGCFPNAGAIEVPRSRFAPVKTTADLLALRSDAYEITPDCRLVLAPELNDRPPLVDLDPDHYKRVDQLEARLRVVPSLKGCRQLRVRGPVIFENPATFKGNITVTNPEKSESSLPAGSYEDLCLTLRGGRVETSPNPG